MPITAVGPEKPTTNGDYSAEEISFRPHFDTLTRSGQWEYYKSEGVDVIPCAFADLIDNSLQATSDKQKREIVVEIHLESQTPFIYIADNGKGMSKKELAEYPIYRLGRERKQLREQGSTENRAPQGVLLPQLSESERTPRYLTSEIGYFGVGGKQAAFRLGKRITIMTKSGGTDGANNVGCLTLSEDEFERLDAAGEDPYRTMVHWRQTGNLSNQTVTTDRAFNSFLESELNYDTFTRVFISQLQPDTITYLSENFDSLTKTLAGIYHYYLHGPDGRSRDSSRPPMDGVEKTPTIRATPAGRGRRGGGAARGRIAGTPAQQKGTHQGTDYDLQLIFRLFGARNAEVNLGDIDSDFQSKCQMSEIDRFNFVVEIPEQNERAHSSTGYNGVKTIVEGFIRYHPFDLTHETLPFREEVLKQLQKEQQESAQTATSASSSEETITSTPMPPPASTPAPHGRGSKQASVNGRLSYLSTPQVQNSFMLSTPGSQIAAAASDQEQPIDPALSTQNALISQKPEFDLFWNGRLVPNSRVPFSMWKWTEKGKRGQFGQEIYHRVTGCLFFDSSFGVTQNKLTFIDTSILASENITIRPVVDGKVKQAPIADEFLSWIRECNTKYDKYGTFYRREKGTVVRPELKSGAKKQWVVFKGMRMGDLDLKEGSYIKFRTVFQKMLYGKIRRFFVCADNVEENASEVTGFGGDVELELHPDWIRAACANLHLPPPGYVAVAVGNIDFKCSGPQVLQEVETLEKKFPAGLKVDFNSNSSSPMEDDVTERFRDGIPASQVKIVDSTGALVNGRLSGNVCSVGHKPLPADTLQLRVVMRVMKQVDKPAHTPAKGHRAANASQEQWEDRHRVEASYSDKEQSYLFSDVPLSDPGSYRLNFTVVSNLNDVSERLAAKAFHSTSFRIRPSMASSFTVEILQKQQGDNYLRLGEAIPFKVHFVDKSGHPARPPSKFNVHTAIVGESDLKIDCPDIGATVSMDSDDTFKQLDISQVVGRLYQPEETAEKFAPTPIEVAFSIPDFCKTVVKQKFNIHPGAIAAVELSRNAVDIENHSSEKFVVELKDAWGNLTWMSDVKIVIAHPGGERPKTFTLKTHYCTALVPTLVVNATPYSVVPCSVVVKAPSGEFAHALQINVLPSKRPAGLKLVLTEVANGQQHVVTSSQAPNENTIKIAAGKQLSATFAILDEAGGELAMSSVENDLLQTVAISWCPQGVSPKLDDLRSLKLPSLAAPLSIKEPIPHYMSFRDGVNTIRCDFTIGILPLDPVGLAFLGLPSSLPVGAPLPSTIQLALVDVHGNAVAFKQGDVNKITVTPQAKLNFVKGQGVIALSQISVPRITVSGEKIQLEAKFGSFAPAQASITLVPGQPVKLLCVKPNPATVNLVAGQKLNDVSFEFNLVDEHSNICPVEIPQVKMTCPTQDLHFTPELRPRKMKDGTAVFGPYTIAATKSGPFTLTAQLTLPDTSTQLTDKVAVVVSPNPDEAVHIQLGHSFPLVGTAAQQIGNIQIQMLNYARQKLTTPLSSNTIANTRLTFVPSKLKPPVSSTLVSPNEITRESFSFKASEQISPGIFVVHNVQLPSVAGEWSVKFQCHQMSSPEEILVSVSPGEPAQLVLNPSRDCFHLSNGRKTEDRTLIPPSSRFEIADKFGNICQGLNSNLTVELRILGPPNETVPRIDGAQASGRKVVRLDANGKLAPVFLAENTPCTEGVQYQLEVRATAQNDMKPLLQPFSISNDFERAQQCQVLENERQVLKNEMTKLNGMVRDNETRLQGMEAKRRELEEDLGAAMRNANELNNRQFSTLLDEQLEAYLRNLQDNIDTHLNRPRRLCRCRPFDAEVDVLGKVAQLALVDGDDIARVISWNIAGRMDAVVTLTVEKLQDIFRRHQGSQQVVAISLMPNQTRPWDDVLPHQKLTRRGGAVQQDHMPEGNPVYARHCLQISPGENEAAIRKLFHAILGDTIIIDTIEDAFAYRKYLIDRGGQAPTILTRHEGNRLDTLGFAGGGGNRAPPINQLSYVFGAPPPPAISQLRACIESVERLKAARAHSQQFEAQSHQQKDSLQTELRTMYARRKQINERLAAIEKDLNPNPTSVFAPPTTPGGQANSRKRGLPANGDTGVMPSPSRRLR